MMAFFTELISIFSALFVLLMVGVFIYYAMKKPPSSVTRSGRYWRTYGGYGGFSSGGGSFRGGGGGGFGGGGASGSW